MSSWRKAGILVICSHFPESSLSIFTVRVWIGRGDKGAGPAARCCLLLSLSSSPCARLLVLPGLGELALRGWLGSVLPATVWGPWSPLVPMGPSA